MIECKRYPCKTQQACAVGGHCMAYFSDFEAQKISELQKAVIDGKLTITQTQKHYDGWLVGEFITKLGLGFYAGNVIKYVARYQRKDGVKDLKKARDYLDKLIETHKE